MRYNEFTYEEKLVASLLEDEEFRYIYLNILKESKFKNHELLQIVKVMTLENPYAIKDAILLGYAMHLSNGFAESRITNPRTETAKSTEKERREAVISTLPPNQKALSNTSIFSDVYKAFNEFISGSIRKDEYETVYFEWINYVNYKGN